MTKAEAIKLSKRTEYWLRNHSCAWCDQTLLRALTRGCRECFPAEKDFSDRARLRGYPDQWMSKTGRDKKHGL